MASDPQRGQRGASGSSSASDQSGSEERKPQPDEAHSAFTPPLGVPYPPLPEDEHPTSEFALPSGLRPETPAEQEGSAFTPPSSTTGQTPMPMRLHRPELRVHPAARHPCRPPHQRGSLAGPDADDAPDAGGGAAGPRAPGAGR